MPYPIVLQPMVPDTHEYLSVFWQELRPPCIHILLPAQYCIGSGPAIAETVPTAIGIFIAERGDTMKCICDGVNIGDETSAIASIVGALCGTFRGSRSFPEDYLDFLNEQNGFDLELQAGAVLSACENLS